MTQVSKVQIPQCQITSQPSYNAVKIDIHNPQVNAPGNMQNPIQTPNNQNQVYSYPNTPIYEVPKQTIYKPEQKPAAKQPPAVKEVPVVPAPVVVTPPPAPKQETKPVEVKPAEVKAVEVKKPEVATPKVDVNEFITKLTSADFEKQANAMESIAEMTQKSPKQAVELLDVRVVDTLLGIMSKDTTKLEGPSAQQLQIREKIMTGKPVTEAEKAEANKITPMEQAERNKQYAIYTVAIMQKLYGSEVEKMNKTVVPLTEMPGAAGIVEQVKNNPNPMVRAAGLDALSYIQRPEYKQDLTTIFTIAQKDKDVNVQQAATKALEKLAKLAPAPVVNPTPAAQNVQKK